MNSFSKNKIVIFSQSFPFGKSEVFLENELRVLEQKIGDITICNASTDNGFRRKVKSSTTIKSYSYSVTILKRTKSFLHAVFRSEYRNLNNSEEKKIWLAYFSESLSRKSFIEKEGLITDSIYYSYWTDEWALALALLKWEGKIKSFYTRIHGYDLFEERSVGNKIPFRRFVLSMVDRVYCVSMAGKKYLEQKYPEHASKYHLHSLGVFDNGMGPLPAPKEFSIVSCSNLIPIKRVHLIAEILGNSERKYNWIHFGQGRELDRILSIVKKYPNISADFVGHLENEKLITFYKNNPVSCFIHMSETEGGIPVSIQEAVSFGIPILAADSGGVREIVNEITGVLVEHDPVLKSSVLALHGILDDISSSLEGRKLIRSFWKKKFDAEMKYTNFAKHLIDE